MSSSRALQLANTGLVIRRAANDGVRGALRRRGARAGSGQRRCAAAATSSALLKACLITEKGAGACKQAERRTLMICLPA